MGKSKYYYNPETCQYERARISFWNIFWYCSGVAVVGALFFVGIVILSDQFIETEHEAELRKDNASLTKHKIILTAQLETVESSLTELHQKDAFLQGELFEESNEASTTPDLKKNGNAILLAGPADYSDRFEELKSRTNKLFRNTAGVNTAFGSHMNMKSTDAATLESIPTLPPIEEVKTELIVSGFGVRINPFHKGKYAHQGLDLAAPRGSSVFATAPGRVTKINRSSLQAGYGNYVEIDHGNGFVTRYAHMEEITTHVGESLKKGAKIGSVGSSGGSVAPHLHYEIIQQGENIDPMIYMIEGLSSQQYNILAALSKKVNQSLD